MSPAAEHLRCFLGPGDKAKGRAAGLKVSVTELPASSVWESHSLPRVHGPVPKAFSEVQPVRAVPDS